MTVRAASWPDDEARLATLDTGFVTDRIYDVAADESGFRLVEQALTHPLAKRYPIEPEERTRWDFAVVAEEGDAVVGFAAAEYVAWNRRVVLWHLYVASEARGEGIGTRFVEEVVAFARSRDARCVWVETQNINLPAIRFYRGMGFELCGLDTTLYDFPEPEVALYFALPLRAKLV